MTKMQETPLKVKDRATALQAIKRARSDIAPVDVNGYRASELDSLATWVGKAEVASDAYRVCYQVHSYAQGGGDVATYDNMRDVIQRLGMDDKQIVELARTRLGEICGVSTEHYGMADVYVLRKVE